MSKSTAACSEKCTYRTVMIGWTSLYFNSWHDLARVLFLGIPAAEGLVALTLLVLLQ